MNVRSSLARAAAALAALCLGSAGSVQAQDPGVIHYTQDPALYRIPGNGGAVFQVPWAPANVAATTDLSYYGRHRYFHVVNVGQLPGNNLAYGDFYLWDEGTGVSIKLTEFRGPVYTPTYFSRTRWSNDRLDTFFSFYTWDTTTGLRHLVRARISASDIVAAGTTFVPLTQADLGGRLEIVATWPDIMDYIWHPGGGSLYYIDARTASQFKLRIHAVGDTPMDADPVLFDEAVTGHRPDLGDVAPDGSRLVLHVATQSKFGWTGPSGLITLDANTGAWNWLLTDTTGKTGLRKCGGQIFAPDSSGFAFGAERLSNGKVAAEGLYKMSLLDGTITTLREEGSTSPGFGLRRWTR